MTPFNLGTFNTVQQLLTSHFAKLKLALIGIFGSPLLEHLKSLNKNACCPLPVNVLTSILYIPDVNECDKQRIFCHQFATCTNFRGSFSCTCNQGFIGDGFECKRGMACHETWLCDLTIFGILLMTNPEFLVWQRPVVSIHQNIKNFDQTFDPPGPPALTSHHSIPMNLSASTMHTAFQFSGVTLATFRSIYG